MCLFVDKKAEENGKQHVIPFHYKSIIYQRYDDDELLKDDVTIICIVKQRKGK